MKRVLLVLSVLLIVLCGCDISMISRDTSLYIDVTNDNVRDFNEYALKITEGNTSIIKEHVSRYTNPIVVDNITPGTWDIEIRAYRNEKVVGVGKGRVYISKGVENTCSITIEPVFDYSYSTFKATLERIMEEYPYSDGMDKIRYYNELGRKMHTSACYVKMSDSTLRKFTADMENDISSNFPGFELAVTRNEQEFVIVLDSDAGCLTLKQTNRSAWNFSYIDKTLPDAMDSFMDQLQVDSISSFDAKIANVVFHDDYDRIRFIFDCLIDSLENTDAFVGNITESNVDVIAGRLEIIIQKLVEKVPAFTGTPSFEVSLSYSLRFMKITVTISMPDGSSHDYEFKLDENDTWTATRPELPVWKPEQADIDQALADTRNDFIDDLVNGPELVPPATQDDLINDIMDRFTPHLPDYEYITSMDEDQRYLFEGEVAKIIREAFDIMPGVPGVETDPTVTVNVEIDYISFRFIIVIHLDTGEFYTYRYQKNPDGTWTEEKEYDDGVRPDLSGVTYQDYKNNFSAHAHTAYNEVAPGPGYYDMSDMARTPLFWQMSEKQRLQFKKEAGDDGHDELSLLQQKWDMQTFVYDVRIVGNEFRRYYSFYDNSDGRLCQAVTIQHEDGSWEQRFVSEWIALPDDADINLAPSYDDVRADISALEDDLAQKITADLPDIELSTHEQKIGFLMDKLLSSLPGSNKYNGLTDAQIAKLSRDLSAVISNGYDMLPNLPGIDVTFNVNIHIELNVVVIEIHFILPDGSGFTYSAKADGNDSWMIDSPEISIPVPAPDYDVISRDMAAFENRLGTDMEHVNMPLPPRAESERVEYLMNLLPDNLPRILSYKGLTASQKTRFAEDFKAVLDRLLAKVTPIWHPAAVPVFTVDLELNLDILVMKVSVDLGDGNAYAYEFEYNGAFWAPASRPSFPPVTADYKRIESDLDAAKSTIGGILIHNPMPSSYRFESERMMYMFNAIEANMPLIDYRGITSDQMDRLSRYLESMLHSLNYDIAQLPGEDSLSTTFTVNIELELNVLVIRFVVDIGDDVTYTHTCRIDGTEITWEHPSYPEFCRVTIKETLHPDGIHMQVRGKKSSGFLIDDKYLDGFSSIYAVDRVYLESDPSRSYHIGDSIVLEGDCTLVYCIYNKEYLPESLVSNLRNIESDAIEKIGTQSAVVEIRDQYDRIRIMMDALFDSCSNSDAFKHGLSWDNERAFENDFKDLVDRLFVNVPPLRVPASEPEFSVDLQALDPEIRIVIKLAINGQNYQYEMKSSGDTWTFSHADLPEWKPSILDIDAVLGNLRSDILSDMSDDGIYSFDTETRRIEYTAEKFGLHIRGDEIFNMFDSELNSHFETRIKEVLDSVIANLPASNEYAGTLGVNVSVDSTSSTFRFMVEFSYEAGKFHRYTYDMQGDYTFSCTYEYVDNAARPDVPGCTYDAFHENFQRNGHATDNLTAPGPGYWDHSRLDKDPLFWTMSERQLKKYEDDRKVEWNRSELSKLQNDWIMQNYRHEAKIVGNEFFDYYSFYSSTKNSICQAVTIQHTDGTWEQKFISEWTLLPSDAELR